MRARLGRALAASLWAAGRLSAAGRVIPRGPGRDGRAGISDAIPVRPGWTGS